MPRWAFEKFPMADTELTTHMKSVGEAMAIGRTFKEAFLKALRSRELDAAPSLPLERKALTAALSVPSCERYELILHAYRQGFTIDEIHELTAVPRFFLAELADIVGLEAEARRSGPALGAGPLRRLQRYGFSDRRLGELTGTGEHEIRAARLEQGIVPVYKAVDTCAAEFEAETPYFYSTYEDENEALPGQRESIVILGSGPDRIGQGIEFDYCCVHAAMTVRANGYDAIMVNCNPETVSTDYDISDRLYFEPLTFEDVANICANEQPKGVIVQFGGQTPLRIAHELEVAGIAILGTPQDAIDLAEDRGRFGKLLDELGINCPTYGVARARDEALEIGDRIGYPCLVRPSYVLGGRAMEIVYSSAELGALRRHGREREPRSPDPHRQVPGGRDRGRRRRPVGRRRGLHRRHHAARRRGRRALRRLVVRPALDLARRGHARAGPPPDPGPRPGARREGPDERAVRLPELRALRARGQSPGLAHGAVREQGDRRAAGQAGDAHRPGRDAGRARAAASSRAASREREEGGHALQPLPGRRLPAGAQDEGHRRGHGRRRHLPASLRQGPGRGRRAAACRGHHLRVGLRPRQVGGHHPGAAPARPRVRPSSPPGARRAPCRASACRPSRSTK